MKTTKKFTSSDQEKEKQDSQQNIDVEIAEHQSLSTGVTFVNAPTVQVYNPWLEIWEETKHLLGKM